MGRPKSEEEKIQITIKLKKSMYDEIESYSERLGISKTQIVINMIIWRLKR